MIINRRIRVKLLLLPKRSLFLTKSVILLQLIGLIYIICTLKLYYYCTFSFPFAATAIAYTIA